MKLSLLLILALLAGAAAQAGEPATPIMPSNFSKAVGTDWHLASITREGKDAPLAPDAVTTLSFDETGRVAGNATVNRFFGSVKAGADGALAWSELGTTLMAGPEPHMRQESLFLELLPKTTRLRLDDGKLVLESADAKTRLVFTAPK